MKNNYILQTENVFGEPVFYVAAGGHTQNADTATRYDLDSALAQARSLNGWSAYHYKVVRVVD